MAGLALEIDEDEVIARQQHLTEMIIAVDADLGPLGLRGDRGSDALQNLVAGRKHGVGLVAVGTRELAQVTLQQAERILGLLGRAVPVGVEVRPRERLRSERRVLGRCGQRPVELGRARREYPLIIAR